jgi:GNAT superfamily N-acetyltransferase
VDPNVRIEAARAEDLPELARIERAANRLFVDRGVSGVKADDVTALAELSEARGAGLLWVARSDGDAPVGFALLCIVDGAPHVEEIDVDPAHGRRGIGRALLETALAWAREAGHRRVTLTTFREIPWNEPFYASAGFRGLEPHEIGPELAALVRDETARGLDPAQRVVMRRDLPSSTRHVS